MTPNRTPSPGAAVALSCAGHAYAHLFEPIFFVVALVLPGELGLPYAEVLALIVAGKVLYGLAAPLAGWLGDRWSTTGMIAVYFCGLGLAAIGVGLAETPGEMLLGLTALGVFGSIYHPVGLAWLVRSATNKGRALGLNGVFGGLGPAVAGLLAGLLSDAYGWRSAFIVPGAAVVGTGVLFLVLVRVGVIVDRHEHLSSPGPTVGRREAVRAFTTLALTMLCGGLIYQATQAALPKLFAERLADSMAGGLTGVGAAVSAVYGVAGVLQFVTGHLADRHAPRTVYRVLLLAQAPLLALAGYAAGAPLVLAALLAVSANIGVLPAENLLFARYAPPAWRATAFGLKFVLAFGLSAAAVPLVSALHGVAGGFATLFLVLGGLAAVAGVAAVRLPPDVRDNV